VRVNAKSEYAMRAMLDLAARPQEQTTLDEIAGRQRIPATILPGIFQALAKAGLVATVRGYGGGVRLARRPEEITVRMILDALEGALRLYSCDSPNGPCPLGLGRHCPLRALWEKTQDGILQLWTNTSLADLAKTHRAPARRRARRPRALSLRAS